MKKLTLTIVLFGMLLTSCKKEETVTTTTDDGKVTVTTTTTKSNLDLDIAEKAKVDLENAEKNLAEATTKGDKEGQKLAQIAVDKAKTAWEATKEGAKNTREEIKEDYNNALEKAKSK